MQLSVIFEIMHIGNAGSASASIFRMSPSRNPILLLLLGTISALAVPLAAVHMRLFQRALGVEPIPLTQWATLAAIAAGIVIVVEIHKKLRGRHNHIRRNS